MLLFSEGEEIASRIYTVHWVIQTASYLVNLKNPKNEEDICLISH